MMPMTVGDRARFTARHPRAAVIFDNLHMMHDIISDIPRRPRHSRRPEGGSDRGAGSAEFRSAGRNVLTPEQWL